ncbi:hypothetical protein [Sunxiuqinia sp. sy24]|uniref:hypothetical protein n=1 Tax=Sunxiuqinia sp. sy24 TaxID=3461495 RepID=UPI0040458B58
MFFVLFWLVCACQNNKPAAFQNKNTSDYWWPKQPSPKGIIVCEKGTSHGELALAHSLSGLVAQAQKRGLTDELIWMESGGEYANWYKKAVVRLNTEERGQLDVWELLDRYKNSGIIKGYILYKEEPRENWSPDMDFSYNIAVSYAGVKQALAVEEKQKSKLDALGIPMLLDARPISRKHYFDDLKDDLDNKMVVTMSPHFHNNTDLAIANKAIVTYGTDRTTEKIMEWANPVSPVVGWNHGNEDDFTGLPTKYALFNTASDWCSNLITLSAGAETASFTKIKTLDPRTINFDEGNHFHSFIMSDGDNMQWSIGAFIKNKDYWGSPLHGEFPIGFTSCPINLSMMAPDVLDEMAKTQAPHTTVIEYGGGYQYPDHFASKKGREQEQIQREFARKINIHLKRTGVKVFGFICMDVNSREALKAYKIYAEELEDIVGIIAVQYAPYHGGNGEVFWQKNRNGIEIPVVTAKYSLWQGLQYEGGGDIEKVSDCINNHASENEETMDWTVVHAWSRFENPESSGEFARGVKPVSWSINRLNKEIKVVSPEELLWRIRMKHNKTETLQIINQNK